MRVIWELVAAGVLAALALSAPVGAPAAPLSAEEIVRREHEAFLRAGRDFRAEVSMRLVDKDGRERRRGSVHTGVSVCSKPLTGDLCAVQIHKYTHSKKVSR